MTGIYQSIVGAMGDITPIAKNKKNLQQGFMYRGIDDVMSELSPILTKWKIFIYPEVITTERSERKTEKGATLLYSILTIKYHFATDDGSEICTTVIGEGMDSGDKASNKAMAVAFKYACLQMFCIPTCDMQDPDATTPPSSSPISGNGLKQASNGSKTLQNGPKVDDQEKRKILYSEIGTILKTKDPDQFPYFNDLEIGAERELTRKGTIEQLKEQKDRLKAELENRKSKFEPAPFKDDIPWNENIF